MSERGISAIISGPDGVTESLPKLSKALRNGQLSLDVYLAAVEAHFASVEPLVRAFMPEPERFERLRRDAAALRMRWPSPDERPALFGVTVGIKDIMRVDGLPTTAGSQLPPELFEGPESDCVSALRGAGALIIGKTVSTEFAYFAPGPTRNPHNLDHTPGGSSSGSAAAVAARLCTVALGSQTVGSVIRPAAFCGVVGYKPSYGRISKEGVIPLAPSLDTVGVLADDAAGAALSASVLCVKWEPVSSLGRPRFGLPVGPYLDKASDEAREHFGHVVNRVMKAGYSVASVAAMADHDAIWTRHFLIMAAEAAAVHEQWFESHGERYHKSTAALIEQGQAVGDVALAEALLGRENLRGELMALMDDNAIDVWLAPSAVGVAPRGLESTGNPAMNLAWTHSGLPVVSLPSGTDGFGLPFGLQMVGRWQDDERLLSWAEELEPQLKGIEQADKS